MPSIADPDVVIVGAGPAGLSAARRLLECGVGTVTVLDRDDGVGGVPRFCRHLGFGLEYSHRIESGPAFIRRLQRGIESPPLNILTQTTALTIGPGPRIDLTGPQTGPQRLHPRAVLIATGIRETPRGARLVPGDRPQAGILTTGLLQQMVVRGVRRPVGRMVVVGSEHVAFSAIFTARHAGGHTIAVVEPGDRILSYPWAGLLAKCLFGVAIHPRTAVSEVLGRQQVEAVLLTGPAGTFRLACDSVLFAGGWCPEATWLHGSGIAVDDRTGGPIIDQMMRTSLPGVFAAGNVLRGVESSGIAALEGARAAACIAAYLKGELPGDIGRTRIALGPHVQYCVPQRWASDEAEPTGAPPLQPSLRVAAHHRKASLRIRDDGQILWQGSWHRMRPSRRVALSLSSLSGRTLNQQVAIELVDREPVS